jgi:hypothetical protein
MRLFEAATVAVLVHDLLLLAAVCAVRCLDSTALGWRCMEMEESRILPAELLTMGHRTDTCQVHRRQHRHCRRAAADISCCAAVLGGAVAGASAAVRLLLTPCHTVCLLPQLKKGKAQVACCSGFGLTSPPCAQPPAAPPPAAAPSPPAAAARSPL